MTIPRCEHKISVNFAFLERLLHKNATYKYGDVKTNIYFIVELSPEEKKKLASALITAAATEVPVGVGGTK